VHEFWKGSARELEAGELTDIGSWARRTGLYWAEDEASVVLMGKGLSWAPELIRRSRGV
jgi:hypothetical protein